MTFEEAIKSSEYRYSRELVSGGVAAYGYDDGFYHAISDYQTDKATANKLLESAGLSCVEPARL